jgi:hypothetical protein
MTLVLHRLALTLGIVRYEMETQHAYQIDSEADIKRNCV